MNYVPIYKIEDKFRQKADLGLVKLVVMTNIFFQSPLTRN